MKFLVDNMSCMHCVKRIETALKSAGFTDVKIDLKTQTVELELGNLTKDVAKAAVNSIGYNYKEIN